MRRLFASTIALAALAGCGGSASSTPATTPRAVANQPRAAGGATAAGSCQLDRAMSAADTLEIPGTRVRMRLPLADDLVMVRGMALVTHECGLAIMIVAAPPGADSRAFLDGASEEMRPRFEGMGLACREAASAGGETLWSCDGEGMAMRGRRLEDASGGALISVLGPAADVHAMEAIVASAAVDPAATYDPLAQMSIALDPPEGMALSPSSAGGALQYRLRGNAAGGAATTAEPALGWMFVPWEMSDEHADGSPWSDRELGEVAGALVAEADLDQVRGDTMRGGPVAPGVFELMVDAVDQGVPVTLWTWTVRDEHGAFFVIARAPSAEATTWIERFRAHARSLAFEP